MRDYSNVDLFIEEAKNIDAHLPAMVVQLKKGKAPRIRIIPSKKWKRSRLTINLCLGLLVHDSLHISLWRNLNLQVAEAMDNLPRPKTSEEFYSGVWGYGS